MICGRHNTVMVEESDGRVDCYMCIDDRRTLFDLPVNLGSCPIHQVTMMLRGNGELICPGCTYGSDRTPIPNPVDRTIEIKFHVKG
jgi:hypothetical protein